MVDETLLDAFVKAYDCSPDYQATAPGRVNLIGEHTDYNEGFVLPCALQYKTIVLARPRQDSKVNVISLQYPQQREQFDLSGQITPGDYPWGDYVRGVALELIAAGHTLAGVDLAITSDVPQGAGLSSSAALEVAIGGMFNELNGLGLSNAQIARFGQLAENNFIDCQCGIMDQLISAKAQHHAALLIDCENLATQTVEIPDDLSLLVINSNYPRKLADSEYNQRRQACELAAAKMQLSSLRKADMHMLSLIQADIPDEVYRRAKHVITENQRVLDVVKALADSDFERLYSIMHEAHLSLKYDFEITVPATDGLVDICMQALNSKGACRQTGGGFGGAVICLCDKKDAEKVISAVEQQYFAQFGLRADILQCEPSQGLTIQSL
ncbi:galactokinase [Alteromonas flava]|uniref:galactokinase n=1 Tax=Alteromonas flava TaxID=2048003 RepID=UPI000C28306F|nr:galactokinase [Alteromonas flava]